MMVIKQNKIKIEKEKNKSTLLRKWIVLSFGKSTKLNYIYQDENTGLRPVHI